MIGVSPPAYPPVDQAQAAALMFFQDGSGIANGEGAWRVPTVFEHSPIDKIQTGKVFDKCVTGHETWCRGHQGRSPRSPVGKEHAKDDTGKSPDSKCSPIKMF